MEGGARLGQPPHLHLRPLAAWGRESSDWSMCVIISASHWSGDGGAADRPGGAQEAKSRNLQGDLPHRLQAGPSRQPGGQHREVPHGQTGGIVPNDTNHISSNEVTRFSTC